MQYHFKKILLAGMLLLTICSTHAQQEKLPYKHAQCHASYDSAAPAIPDAAAFLSNLQRLGLQTSVTAPYYVRVFIRIVRQDNGTLPGCTVEDALQNFYEMNGQYNGHNICFQLMGIDFVNDSYLNNFNNSSLLDTDYPQYIRDNNLDVDGAITIFVHYNFLNNISSSGNAYGIPNNFLSVARWAVSSNTVHSIFGHEMGHCLGLYHTFASVNGIAEKVTRNSGSACYNCNVGGDLCCDTPADYPNSQDNTSSSSCNYFGTATDNCSNPAQYDPSTSNIMSYQPWECISFNASAVTPNQRSRMHAHILDPQGLINSRVSEDNLTLGTGSYSTSQVRLYGAKYDITTGSNVTITHSGGSQAYFAAGNSITIGPNTHLAPGAAGVVNLSISGCN
jgi:hypothetical protein